MSFEKAAQLVQLAQMAAARRWGVSLTDIRETFGVSHRTAQRMTHALEASFANVTSDDGPDLRRRWRITGTKDLARPRPRQETALEGVDSGRGQDDTLRLPRPSFAPCLSPVVAIVVAMSAAHPFRGCEDGKI